MSSKRDAAVHLRALSAEAPSDMLQRVRSGEVSVEEYIDHATEMALETYRGKVTGEMLEIVRQSLREHLRTDPVMLEQLRQLTGQSVSNSPEPTN
ncbi:MAG: hypothetical protein QM784_21875 [Polyangiaceae bacterium]